MKKQKTSFGHTLKITFELLFVALAKAFIEYMEMLVHELFDVERGQLKHIPNFVIFLIYVLCLSVLFQAGMDLILESLVLTGVLGKMPLRLDFIFLTIISTVMGVQTLKGMSQRKLDVTRNSILIGIIVESALIIGDLAFIYKEGANIDLLPYVRIPFLALTSMNLAILVFVSFKLKVFRDRKGHLEIF